MEWKPGMTLKQAKAAVLDRALLFHDGNKNQTAKELGISRRALLNYVREMPELKHWRRPAPRRNIGRPI